MCDATMLIAVQLTGQKNYHMLTVSELYIYPIKSLGGFNVNAATLTDRGFEHDRRWMLVDENNVFLSQRELTAMALLKVKLNDNGLEIYHSQKDAEHIVVSFQNNGGEQLRVRVWDDDCDAITVSKTIDDWFSEMLSIKCRLVYMPDKSDRFVEKPYAKDNEITSFSDGYPILMIGQSSLDDLNARLAQPLPMNRFRPNIVFTGGTAFQEDEIKSFTINGVTFSCVKPCARCVVTTIDQRTGSKNKEPLKTLSTYRLRNNKIYFGQNILYKGLGTVRVGDVMQLL